RTDPRHAGELFSGIQTWLVDFASFRAEWRPLWAFRIARLSKLAPLFANCLARIGRLALPSSAVRFDCLFLNATTGEPLARVSEMMPVASLDNSRILLIISEATSEHPSICRLAAGYSVSGLHGCSESTAPRPWWVHPRVREGR